MTAAEKVRARIAELQGIRERYLAYQQDRVNERDRHGAWDVAVNLSETECEISGLEFALKAFEECAWAVPRAQGDRMCGDMFRCVLAEGHQHFHNGQPAVTQTFWVPGPLPGENEIIAACKSGRGKGNAYSRMKAAWTSAVALHARTARIRPVQRAHVRFIWHEKDKRRNPDNVAAAIKFCLDGLVVAKVLENDGWGQVVGFTHAWEVSEKPGVMVSLFSSPEVVSVHNVPF